MTSPAETTTGTAVWGNAGYTVPSDLGAAVHSIRRNLPTILVAINGATNTRAGTPRVVNKAWACPAPSPVVSPTIRQEAEVRQRLELIELLSVRDRENDVFLNISERSRESAVDFLNNLKDTHITPRVMEDGEGDLIFFWGNPAVLMITVENEYLHTIVHPGRSDATYVPTERVEQGSAPVSVVRRVPSIEHASLPSL